VPVVEVRQYPKSDVKYRFVIDTASPMVVGGLFRTFVSYIALRAEHISDWYRTNSLLMILCCSMAQLGA
jgi:hypothetical protein